MDLAAYLSYCFVMRFTPGPNNLMSLAQSRERTFRGALPFLLGLHVSLFSMCTVIYLFIHALEDILPLMDLPLRILGALYLVYLTVRLFMKNGGKKTKTIDSKRLFFSALLLNWTNVKVALFMMVGYTSFLLPGGGGPVSSRHGHEPYVQCSQFYLGPRRLPLGPLLQGSRKACLFDDCVLASLFCRKDPFPQSLLGLGTFVNGCKTSAEDPSG